MQLGAFPSQSKFRSQQSFISILQQSQRNLLKMKNEIGVVLYLCGKRLKMSEQAYWKRVGEENRAFGKQQAVPFPPSVCSTATSTIRRFGAFR